MTKATIYELLTKAGCETANHESDLYVKDTPEARAIIEGHGEFKIKPFTADDGSGTWIEIPFQYDPFWASKA